MGDVSESAVRRLDSLIRRQDGVVARRQALDCGVDVAYIRRRLRREWVTVHPGVYVTHTGPLTWLQRAWAAVLDAAPAVLSHQSAVQAVLHNGSGPIHISVDRRRRVTRRPGVVVHYRSDLDDVALYNSHPPRMRLEDAVVELAAGAEDTKSAVAYFADAVQARITTADRLLDALNARLRVRHSEFLRRVLADVRDGACSALEHRYLVAVERAHGLPTGARQKESASGRRGLRDVVYEDWGVIVELDGRLFHDNATSYDRDLERDLDAAAAEDLRTVRAGYGQVFDRSCSTAAKITVILQRLGWPDEPRTCDSPDCSIRLMP